MKRQTILLLLSVLLLSGGAAAQSTKEQTLEDLNRTAALYYCYENHPRAAATPAPEGYEPFYISHYGRHGSRWHASESVYENPRAKLRKAAKGRPSGGVPGHKALAGRLPRELKALRGGRQKRLFACRGRTRTQARKAGARPVKTGGGVKLRIGSAERCQSARHAAQDSTGRS